MYLQSSASASTRETMAETASAMNDTTFVAHAETMGASAMNDTTSVAHAETMGAAMDALAAHESLTQSAQEIAGQCNGAFYESLTWTPAMPHAKMKTPSMNARSRTRERSTPSVAHSERHGGRRFRHTSTGAASTRIPESVVHLIPL